MSQAVEDKSKEHVLLMSYANPASAWLAACSSCSLLAVFRHRPSFTGRQSTQLALMCSVWHISSAMVKPASLRTSRRNSIQVLLNALVCAGHLQIVSVLVCQ